MKLRRKNIYNTLMNLAAMNLKNKVSIEDEKSFNQAIGMSKEINRREIDKAFNNMYKDGLDRKREIIGCCVILFISLFIPLGFMHKILIGILCCVVFEFIVTRGIRFFFNDVAKEIMFKPEEIEIHYKPKTNVYELILMGVNPETGVLDVYKYGSKTKDTKLIKPKIYLADKETLSEVIRKYSSGKYEDVTVLIKTLEDNIFSQYVALGVDIRSNMETSKNF